MNSLLKKYNDYMRLKGCTVEYTLQDGSKVTFAYDEKAFLHLLGLHKLSDLQLIQFWQDKNNKTVKLNTVLQRIKKEKFTDSDVQSSVHFHKIQDRYDSFCYENLTTLNYTDAIIDFNPARLNSKLRSNYILFEEKNTGEYNHMGIAADPSGYNYVESFFHETSDKYISGQHIIPIKTFRIIEPNGRILVEDSFENS